MQSCMKSKHESMSSIFIVVDDRLEDVYANNKYPTPIRCNVYLWKLICES